MFYVVSNKTIRVIIIQDFEKCSLIPYEYQMYQNDQMCALLCCSTKEITFMERMVETPLVSPNKKKEGNFCK